LNTTPPSNAEAMASPPAWEISDRKLRPSSPVLPIGESQGQQQYPDRIIPVEQLERPFPARQFLGIRPGAPAQHGDYAQSDGERVGFNNQHDTVLVVFLYPSLLQTRPSQVPRCSQAVMSAANEFISAANG
jgi:hypothetical protein